MMTRMYSLIKQGINLINVRNNILIFWKLVGNKVSDKIDELTHPNESKKDRIIRKTKNYINNVKEDVNEAYGNIKEKYFH